VKKGIREDDLEWGSFHDSHFDPPDDNEEDEEEYEEDPWNSADAQWKEDLEGP